MNPKGFTTNFLLFRLGYLTINEEKTKELLKEILIDMMQSKRELFSEIVLEALEDVGLANAIKEGKDDENVSREEIFVLLEEESSWKLNFGKHLRKI